MRDDVSLAIYAAVMPDDFLPLTIVVGTRNIAKTFLEHNA